MTRRRSEHRLPLAPDRGATPADLRCRPVDAADAGELATLLLGAYRGTVDDEGEGEPEARDAVAYYLAVLDPETSVVLVEGGRIVALSIIVTVGGRRYVDPVATAPERKGNGLGAAAVAESLRRLQERGEPEVGAVITDGNVPSERLFARLGFTRVGPWG